jgi:multidrug efflux pump subunit AcrA (membrane-fusion protein)
MESSGRARETSSAERETFRRRLTAIGPWIRRRTTHVRGFGPVVVGCGALVLLGGFWLLGHGAGSPPAPEDGLPRKRTATVERRVVEDVFLLSGETRAVRSLDIAAPRTASWQMMQIKWLAEDGAEVEAGDPLIEFDNTRVVQRIEEIRLRQTQAEIALASREKTLAAEAEKKRVAVELAEIEVRKARLDAEVPVELRSRREWHQKQTDLHEREAALSKARQDLTTFGETSQGEMENLRLALEKASRQLAQAEGELDLLSVRATQPGIFIVAPHPQRWLETRKLQVGDTVFPGVTVASIPDMAEMEVEAFLPAVDEGRVASGQPARCVLDTYPNEVFAGRVVEVTAVALDERDRSGFPVRVTLERSDPHVMRPGMSVRVEVIRHRYENVLAVPRGAVVWSEGHARVRRPGGSATDARLAACTPTDCVVESGIEEGDSVAL